MAKKHTVKKGKASKRNTQWIQPTFDPRIYTMPFGLDKDNEEGTTLHRGLIKQSIPVAGVAGRNQLAFLYNPSQVAASYSLASMDQQSSMLYPQAGDDATIRLPLNQSVTFSLLFDRTYELWDSSKKSTSAGTYGVMVDVWALQQLVGMNADPAAAKGGSGKDSTLGSSGLMMTTFCDFYFGGRSSLQYFGSIQAFDVTYTHWTQLMVPMRCAINVTVQLYPEDVRTDLISGAKAKKAAASDAPTWSTIPRSPLGTGNNPIGLKNPSGLAGR